MGLLRSSQGNCSVSRKPTSIGKTCIGRTWLIGVVESSAPGRCRVRCHPCGAGAALARRSGRPDRRRITFRQAVSAFCQLHLDDTELLLRLNAHIEDVRTVGEMLHGLRAARDASGDTTDDSRDLAAEDVDRVLQASLESFPASDAPGWAAGRS
jgi:hypothetical protein